MSLLSIPPFSAWTGFHHLSDFSSEEHLLFLMHKVLQTRTHQSDLPLADKADGDGSQKLLARQIKGASDKGEAFTAH